MVLPAVGAASGGFGGGSSERRAAASVDLFAAALPHCTPGCRLERDARRATRLLRLRSGGLAALLLGLVVLGSNLLARCWVSGTAEVVVSDAWLPLPAPAKPGGHCGQARATSRMSLRPLSPRRHSRRSLLPRRAGEAATEPGMYRALAKLKVRMAPEVDSALLADYSNKKIRVGDWVIQVNPKDYFEVSEVRAGADGQTFLKLADQEGWLVSQGVKGEWRNRPVVERIEGLDAFKAKYESYKAYVLRLVNRNPEDGASFAIIVTIIAVVILTVLKELPYFIQILNDD